MATQASRAGTHLLGIVDITLYVEHWACGDLNGKHRQHGTQAASSIASAGTVLQLPASVKTERVSRLNVGETQRSVTHNPEAFFHKCRLKCVRRTHEYDDAGSRRIPDQPCPTPVNARLIQGHL